MVSSLGTRRLLRESAPVAVILAFWGVLASFVQPAIAAGLLRAGVVMALLYTVVRGVTLSRTHSATDQPNGLEGILRENVRVAIPAGGWFLVAQVAAELPALRIPLNVWRALDRLSFAFVGAGVAVVLLYAIAIGLPRMRGATAATGGDGTGATPADD